MQDYLKYTLYRLENAILEVDALRDEDFAYRDVEDAVERVAVILREHKRRLSKRKAPVVEDIQVNYCLDAVEDISIYLPFLGVIIRSAATRNAFEIYGPIKSIARKLLGASVRLIISSGWDYTPLTFRPIKRFEDYVIVVLPACESANPLLIPLAGHELGHSVWRNEEIRDELENIAANALVEAIRARKDVVDYWRDLRKMPVRKARTRLERNSFVFPAAYEWLLRQLEEMFCDFVGLYLFGESYVRAFAYFLSPDSPNPQEPRYPSVTTRMQQLYRAADTFEATWEQQNYVLPNAMNESIKAPYLRTGTLMTFPLTSNPWRDVVNAVAADLVPQLTSKIVQFGRRKSWKELRQFSLAKRTEIVDKSYRWAVPAAKAKNLSNILNAAWDVEANPEIWRNLPSLASLEAGQSERRQKEMLKELVLKNIEVLEYESKCRDI